MQKSDVRSEKPEVALVCFALKEEAGAFQTLTAGREDVSILITGIGRQNAEKSIREYLQRNLPKHVFTCGFAGGLDPELEIGDVVFLTADGLLDKELIGFGAEPARLLCSPRIAITAAEKLELWRTTKMSAVEMESGAIHEVCAGRGIPCATVRVISDTAHEDLPLDFNQLSNPDQSLNFGKLAWAMAKSPGKIPALLRLQKNCRFAAERLAAVLEKVTALKLPPMEP